MKVKPWEKVGPVEVLAESHKRRLITQKFRDPHNNQIREHSIFKPLQRFSCIVLGITSDEKVLAVRQFRKPVETVTLELPGGCPKFEGQSLELVAKEEFAEETGGYEPGKIISLGKKTHRWFEPSGMDALYYSFLFLGCQKSNPQVQQDEGEYCELVAIPLPEWIKMCLSGEIVDSKSIVTTTLALPHLAKNINIERRIVWT